MKAQPLNDLSRCCVHSITTKPWTLRQAVENYSSIGIPAITVWRDALKGIDPTEAKNMLDDSGLEVVSYCRGGFFPHRSSEDRQKAIDDNRRALDEASGIGAPLLVLVCGAAPGQPLTASREQIRAGMEAILPHAEACGVSLAIESLHPMYADDRSAINTLKQANDLAESFNSPWVGVAVDVYHLWWDPDLQKEIKRCGENGNLAAFHVCDWKTPTKDLLLDRGLMGEGCINLREIRTWVEEAGFSGFIEVEIFSKYYWQMDQSEFLNQIVKAYLKHV